MTASPHSRVRWYVITIVLLSVSIFFAWSLRQGHVLGDDFAMYILQAKNFADGQVHRPTGYLFNPAVPHVGPSEYPPVVPLILALPYQWRGLDLQSMKVALFAVFLLALIPLYLLTNEYIRDPIWSGVAVLAFAFNPLMPDLFNSIGSDLVLLPFVFWLLYIADVAYPKCSTPWGRLALAVLCGLLGYLGYATRTVGATLILVLPAVDLLRSRRITRLTVASLAAVGCCFALHVFVLRPGTHDAALLRLFLFSPQHIFSAASSYLRNARALIPVHWKPLSFLLYFLLLTLSVLGAWQSARKRPTAVGIFTAGYLVVIILYEATPLRYMLPLLPIVPLLVVTGSSWLTARMPALKPVLGLAFALYAIGCLNAAARVDRSPILEGISDPKLIEISRYIVDHTDPGAVVISRKARLLALMTGRSAATASSENVEAYLRSVHAAYILISDDIPDESIATQAPLKSLLAANSAEFPLALSTGQYRLYRCDFAGQNP